MASPIDRADRFLRLDRPLLRLVVVARFLEMDMREMDMEDDDREDVYPMTPHKANEILNEHGKKRMVYY